MKYSKYNIIIGRYNEQILVDIFVDNILNHGSQHIVLDIVLLPCNLSTVVWNIIKSISSYRYMYIKSRK